MKFHLLRFLPLISALFVSIEGFSSQIYEISTNEEMISIGSFESDNISFITSRSSVLSHSVEVLRRIQPVSSSPPSENDDHISQKSLEIKEEESAKSASSSALSYSEEMLRRIQRLELKLSQLSPSSSENDDNISLKSSSRSVEKSVKSESSLKSQQIENIFKQLQNIESILRGQTNTIKINAPEHSSSYNDNYPQDIEKSSPQAIPENDMSRILEQILQLYTSTAPLAGPNSSLLHEHSAEIKDLNKENVVSTFQPQIETPIAPQPRTTVTPTPTVAPVAPVTQPTAPIVTPTPTVAPVAPVTQPTAPIATPTPTVAPVAPVTQPTAPIATPTPTVAPVAPVTQPTAPIATPTPTVAPVAPTTQPAVPKTLPPKIQKLSDFTKQGKKIFINQLGGYDHSSKTIKARTWSLNDLVTFSKKGSYTLKLGNWSGGKRVNILIYVTIPQNANKKKMMKCLDSIASEILISHIFKRSSTWKYNKHGFKATVRYKPAKKR